MRKADKILAEAERLLEGWHDEKADRYILATEEERRKGYAVLLPLAESGNAKAQLKLGQCFLRGNGVAEDKKLAVKWLERAAKQGLDDAQYELGSYYLKLYESWQDRRVSNLRLAHKWIKKASDQGYYWVRLHGALEQCTLAYQRRARAQFRQVLAAAEAGNAEAQHAVFVGYLGGYGVKADAEKAAFWHRKFEEQQDDYLGELKQRADAGDEEADIQHALHSTKAALMKKDKRKKKGTSARRKPGKGVKTRRALPRSRCRRNI
jgi:TPR repeat protein